MPSSLVRRAFLTDYVILNALKYCVRVLRKHSRRPKALKIAIHFLHAVESAYPMYFRGEELFFFTTHRICYVRRASFNPSAIIISPFLPCTEINVTVHSLHLPWQSCLQCICLRSGNGFFSPPQWNGVSSSSVSSSSVRYVRVLCRNM